MTIDIALRETLTELTMTVINLEETRDGINEAINSLQRRITELRNAAKDQQE